MGCYLIDGHSKTVVDSLNPDSVAFSLRFKFGGLDQSSLRIAAHTLMQA